VAGVVGEAGERDWSAGVAGEPELRAAGFARLAGDWSDAAGGGCLVGGVAAVQERPNLSDDLGQVDLTDAWQRREQLGFGVGEQQCSDGGVELGDGVQCGLDERRLRANELGQHGGVEAKGRDGGVAEPLERRTPSGT